MGTIKWSIFRCKGGVIQHANAHTVDWQEESPAQHYFVVQDVFLMVSIAVVNMDILGQVVGETVLHTAYAVLSIAQSLRTRK